MEPIALYLVGGFLGSGKTTFVQKLLGQLPNQKIGLLVNEFGSIGIDGAVLRDGDVKLVEINNGSIFCACLKDGFVRTLKAMNEQPIDLLLIETSGMADPAGMSSILEHLAPYLARGYDYRGMVCLVDCVTFPDYADILLPVQNQVATADLILVNKTDLVTEQEVRAILQTIRGLNEDAVVYQTTYADLPFALLEQNLMCHGRAGTSSNTPWNRPATYTLETSVLPGGQTELRAFYTAVAPYILRMKGFVDTGEGRVHVDGVCDQLQLSSTGGQEQLVGRLVLIGKTPTDFSQAVRAAWEAVFHTPMTLSES